MRQARGMEAGRRSELRRPCLRRPGAVAAAGLRVSGTCGLWRPYANGWEWVSPSATCPHRSSCNPIAQLVTTPVGRGGWLGLRRARRHRSRSFSLQGNLLGAHGWQAAVIPDNAGPVENCPDRLAQAAYKCLPGHVAYPGAGSSADRPPPPLRLVRRLPEQPVRQLHRHLRGASVTLADGTATARRDHRRPDHVELAWQRRRPAVAYDACRQRRDQARARVDRRPAARRRAA